MKQSNTETRLLIVNLDVVVRRPLQGKGSLPTEFSFRPDDQELVPEAMAAISDYQNNGWAIAGVNHPKYLGKASEGDCIRRQRRTQELGFSGPIYFPLEDGNNCCEVWTDSAHYFHRRGLSSFCLSYPGILQCAIISRMRRENRKGSLDEDWASCRDKLLEGRLDFPVVYVGDVALYDDHAADDAGIAFLGKRAFCETSGKENNHGRI